MHPNQIGQSVRSGLFEYACVPKPTSSFSRPHTTTRTAVMGTGPDLLQNAQGIAGMGPGAVAMGIKSSAAAAVAAEVDVDGAGV